MEPLAFSIAYTFVAVALSLAAGLACAAYCT
jgi:hypothetical protein